MPGRYSRFEFLIALPQRKKGDEALERGGLETVVADAGAPRDAMGRAARKWHLRRCIKSMECPDAPAERPRPAPGQALSRSLVALDQNSTIIAVVEMSQSSWLVGGVLPGIERQPCKKLEPSPERLLAVLHRWRDEAVRAGRTIRPRPASPHRNPRWRERDSNPRSPGYGGARCSWRRCDATDAAIMKSGTPIGRVAEDE